MRINTYDIDGVIFMGKDHVGLIPGPDDHIITGRSFEEVEETKAFLASRGIHNRVHFNDLPYDMKSRHSSGIHKGLVIQKLIADGYDVGIHFEDDPIQAKEIRNLVPSVQVVMIVHDLVTKENARHTEW